MSGMTKIAETKFKANLVREYSSTPHVDQLGQHEQTATLYQFGPDTYCVEWVVEAVDSVVQIGIWTDATKDAPTKRVCDYDGVFSLPREIVAFLTAQGFDCKEVTA